MTSTLSVLGQFSEVPLPFPLDTWRPPPFPVSLAPAMEAPNPPCRSQPDLLVLRQAVEDLVAALQLQHAVAGAPPSVALCLPPGPLAADAWSRVAAEEAVRWTNAVARSDAAERSAVLAAAAPGPSAVALPAGDVPAALRLAVKACFTRLVSGGLLHRDAWGTFDMQEMLLPAGSTDHQAWVAASYAARAVSAAMSTLTVDSGGGGARSSTAAGNVGAAGRPGAGNGGVAGSTEDAVGWVDDIRARRAIREVDIIDLTVDCEHPAPPAGTGAADKPPQHPSAPLGERGRGHLNLRPLPGRPRGLARGDTRHRTHKRGAVNAGATDSLQGCAGGGSLAAAAVGRGGGHANACPTADTSSAAGPANVSEQDAGSAAAPFSRGAPAASTESAGVQAQTTAAAAMAAAWVAPASLVPARRTLPSRNAAVAAGQWTQRDRQILRKFVLSGCWGLWCFMRRALSAPRTDREIRAQAVAMCATDRLMALGRSRAHVDKPTRQRGVPHWWHPSEVGQLLHLLLHEVGWGKWAPLTARFGGGRSEQALLSKSTHLALLVPDVNALWVQHASTRRGR